MAPPGALNPTGRRRVARRRAGKRRGASEWGRDPTAVGLSADTGTEGRLPRQPRPRAERGLVPDAPRPGRGGAGTGRLITIA